MKHQQIRMDWPADKLVKALSLVIDEHPFTPMRKRLTKSKLSKLAKQGRLEMDNMDTEWLYRLCAASLMLHDYHWYAWEWRSKWAQQLASEPWVWPRWSGVEGELAREHGIETAGQKRVLVLGEQGIGDEIVFSSCYHDLAKDVEEAWIEVDPRLIPIFTRSFPENLHFVDRYVSARKRIVPRMSDYPKFHEGRPIEAFIMAGNVPKLYRHSPKDFPDHGKSEGWSGGFLVADKDEVERQCEYLEDLEKQWLIPQIGCSWKGRQGEIDPIENGVSLQYGENVHHWLWPPNIDLKWDLEKVFALIAALDKVVTTTNAVAHMAGSIGAPTDCIKPKPIYATKDDGFNNRVSAWWADDYSDWYPSIKMYRSQQEWRAKQ